MIMMYYSYENLNRRSSCIIDDVLYYCYKELSTFMITYHYEQTIPNVYCAL